MDVTNFQNIVELAPNEESAKKVKLILNEIFEDENVDVPDPYFGLENGFSKVYDMLDQVCDKIAEKLKKKHL
jgi:protein-tyrosine phosphatase